MSTIEAYGLSDVGRTRHHNEDQFFIGTLRKRLEVEQTSLESKEAFDHFTRTDAHLLLVADGVGGVAGGRRASQTAVHTLATYIGQTAGCYYNFDVEQEDEFLSRLERSMERAHQAVRSLGADGRGPATTLTLAVVIGSRTYVAHVGDSRGYHLRGARLRQFTRDQTMADALTDAGAITEEQARAGGLDNVLASALGAADMKPAIGVLDLVPGDALLLCSDGLTKHVADDAIRAVLSAGHTVEQACHALVDAALAGGGSDNVTVVVAQAR